MSSADFKTKMRRLYLLLILLGLLKCSAKVAVEETVPFLIQLKEPALVNFYLEQQNKGLKGQSLNKVVNEHATRLVKEQDRLAESLHTRNIRINQRFQRVINAVRVNISEKTAQYLTQLPSVKQLERPRSYGLMTKKSVPAVGAKTVWGMPRTGFDGEGIRVAVIDSGIDYTHAMFGGAGTKDAYIANDPSTIETGSFPTPKVGGWDFAGKNYKGANDEPQPDADPLDRSGYGHGTHVAGILAGIGVTISGKPYTGPYFSELNYDEFKIRPGVAPKAKLFALKVFGDNALGSTGVVLDALEWCVDPNKDNQFDDRMDVVNLSLSTILGLEEKHEIEAEAFRNLSSIGCVVVAASGNSNNNNFYLVGAPGVERSVICVGASKLDGETQRIATLSARGPSSPYSLLKPEIVAPGELIQSAKMGSGFEASWLNGSSLSTPHVAGAAALALQAHPGWNTSEIKALLLNTATTLNNEDGLVYPESLAGAGFLNVAKAVETFVTIMAEGSDGLTTLSLGSLALSKPTTIKKNIRITNHKNTPVLYEMAVEETVQESGFAILLPLNKTVQVPANSHKLVQVSFHADPSQFDRIGDSITPNTINGRARSWVYEVSGKIRFNGEGNTLRLPYHAIVRSAAEKKTTVKKIGLPHQDTVAFTLPLQGESAHPKPLVSVFELAAVSPRKNSLKDPSDIAGDVLALGVASDYPQVGSVEKTTLYFGIANAGPWTNPHSFLYDPHLQIDTDLNGWFDHELASCSNGGLLKGDLTISAYADDVLLSVLIKSPNEEYEISEAGFLNVFPPNHYDTAPFNNSVMVLPIAAKKLGLNEENSVFDFRVLSLGAEQYGYPEIDRTKLIRYDVTKPIVESAFGIDGTVMFDANQSVRVKINRHMANLKNARPAVMIMHHMNTGSHKLDLVEIKLDTDDVDRDGIVDLEELNLYGDLTTTNSPLNTDSDKDGATDANELAAGTDPNNPRSVFALNPEVLTTPLGTKLKWNSVFGKFYLVQRTPKLDQKFETISDLEPATPPINTFTDKTAPLNQGFFYRILKP